MIRLSTFEDRAFETVKNISQESFDELKLDSEIIKHAYTQFVVFKNIQLNGAEYDNFLNEISDLNLGEVNIKIASSQELLLQANRVILNLLLSFKFFIDNAESYLKRKYGKESDIPKGFIALTNQEFDDKFSYRFLSKIRNYSIHLGFPLRSLQIIAEKKLDTPENMIGSLQLKIDIDLIRKEKSLLGSIVFNEIKHLKDDIDLKPLIVELSNTIHKFQKYIFSNQLEEIENAISNIEYFAGNNKTPSNEIKVFNNLKENGNVVNFNAYHVPFEIIEEFNQYIKNWC